MNKMSKWNHVISSDVFDLINGYAFKSKNFKESPAEGLLPIIKIKNVANGDVNLDKVVYHKIDESLGKYVLNNGDVLIAMTGNHPQALTQVVGDVSRYKLLEKSYLNQRVGKIIAINGNSLDFIYYFMKCKLTRDYLASQSSGSASQANISKYDILSIPMYIPKPKEQKAIAEVLSSLDDKIDLLHRQNKTLEQMAETLFRQWFVEEANEDWEEGKLGDLVTVKRGGSPRPIQNYLSQSGYRWLKISDATKELSPFIFEIKEHIKEEGLKKTTLLKAGKLVLSNSATPGLPKILQVDTCIHDGWLHFPVSHFSNEFLYLLFKKIRPELLQLGNGSIFTNLKTDILKEYMIPIADDESLVSFDNQVKPLFAKILSNQIQINTLKQMRNTLLPRLIKGEVLVEN
jgi:type I restriction enzyme S subunit